MAKKEKNNPRSRVGLLSGIKHITGKARSILLRTPRPSDEKVRRFLDHDSEMGSRARLRDNAGETEKNGNPVKRTFAKPAGHGLLYDIQQMKKDIGSLKKQGNDRQITNTKQKSTTETLQKRDTEQQFLNESLSTSVAQLQISSEATKDIRWRLYDSYKRDKVMRELKASRTIRAGNLWAHDGNALIDVVLFEHDTAMQDRATYLELYGWQLEKVLSYRKYTDHVVNWELIISTGGKRNDYKLFLVLDRRANILLQGKPVAKALDAAFRGFLSAVEHFGLEDFGTDSPVCNAYYAFWTAYPSPQQVAGGSEGHNLGPDRSSLMGSGAAG